MALQPVLTVQSTGCSLLAPVLLLACWRTCRIGHTFGPQFGFAAHIGRFHVDPLSCYVFGEIAFGEIPSLRT